MIQFSARDFEIDPPKTKIREWWQAELNIQATFTVKVDGETILEEPHWCVVEMVHALNRWVSEGDWKLDFVYESMDDEEPELLWFKQSTSGAWSIGSAWQQREVRTLVATEALQTAVQTFTGNVQNTVESELGVKLNDFNEFAA